MKEIEFKLFWLIEIYFCNTCYIPCISKLAVMVDLLLVCSDFTGGSGLATYLMHSTVTREFPVVSVVLSKVKINLYLLSFPLQSASGNNFNTDVKNCKDIYWMWSRNTSHTAAEHILVDHNFTGS